MPEVATKGKRGEGPRRMIVDMEKRVAYNAR